MAWVLQDRDVLPSSIIPTLANDPEFSTLTTLNSYINSSTKLYDLLNSARSFTFLAPTNDAFSAWITGLNSTPSIDLVEATLSYHLLNGSYPTVDFTTTSQFVATSLTNQSYNNVTVTPPGQRVELLADSSGSPEIISSNKSVTTIASTRDIVCLNGLIQVVNSILAIPTSVVLLTAQAHMSYFIAILNRANFLAVDDSGLIDFVNYASFTPNMTFFVPNTAEALSHFTNISTGLSAENLTALFDYHIVPNYVGYSTNLTNGTVLTSTQGTNITITTQGSDIYVNSAKIIDPDYFVVNGVIHVIDSILDRFNTTIPPQVINSTSASASSHKSLSTGAIVGVSVAIPIVFIAALASLILYLLKRRKSRKNAAQHDPGTGQASKELDATSRPRELAGGDPSKELPGDGPKRELQELNAKDNPTEMYAPREPVELE